MSKVNNIVLEFSPSESKDVVGYKLYITQAPEPVTYESKVINLGNNNMVVLNELKDMPTTDNIYNLGVTAIDIAGNESSMSLLDNVPLDFTAPDAPGELLLMPANIIKKMIK